MPYDNLQQASKALASAIRTKAEALTFSPTSETVDLLEGAALVKASQHVESMLSVVPVSLLDGSSSAWVRPADWLAMPTLTQADNTFAGLFAVFPLGGNLVALKAKGAYTVDWGDGVIQNFANDALAEHEYSYSGFDLAESTLTSRGYKQAMVRVYPQAGNTLTDLNFGIKHSKLGTLSTPTVNFLDIRIYSSTLAILYLEHPSPSSTRTIKMRLLESFELSCAPGFGVINYLLYDNKALRSIVIKDCTSQSMNYTFQNCSALQSLYLDVACPYMTYTFASCTSLNDVSLFNIRGGTDAQYCFNLCHSLKYLPDLLFDGATLNASSMFQSSGLIEAPNITAGSVSATSMFASCTRLVRVKNLNFVNCTSYTTMFNTCSSLNELAPISLHPASVSDMFSGCTALLNPPQITINANMSLARLFAGSGIVRSVHSEWLTCNASITSMYAMYIGCPQLAELVIDNLYGCADIGQLTSSASCQIMVLPNLSGISSTYTGVFTTATGCLRKLTALGIKDTFTVANQMLSAAALNAIFNNLATVSGKTITVTGNYGVNEPGYDSTIATAKGWTVTA